MSSVIINARGRVENGGVGGAPPHLSDSTSCRPLCAEAVGSPAVLVDKRWGSLLAVHARCGASARHTGAAGRWQLVRTIWHESHLPDVDPPCSRQTRAGVMGAIRRFGVSARVAMAACQRRAAGPIRLLSGATESVVAVPSEPAASSTPLVPGDVLHGATAALASASPTPAYAGIPPSAAEVATAAGRARRAPRLVGRSCCS